MRTTAIPGVIFAWAFNLFFLNTAHAQKTQATYDQGVIINGVKWATRNVDEFRTFAESPDSPGKLYQWNRRKAWNAHDAEVEHWDDSTPKGTEWEKANDPCPAGWRLPTLKEFEQLASSASTWTTLNGVKGYSFGTGDSSIFLPAAGERYGEMSGRLVDSGVLGNYWSRTAHSDERAHLLFFFYFRVDTGGVGDYKRNGNSIRCVSE